MSMTADQVITRAFLIAQRKSTAPTSGTNKYNALLALCDVMQKQWENEPDTEWNSLYSLVTIGTVTATDTFDLDDTINFISKRETDFITLTNGTQSARYMLVTPNQLYDYKDYNAVAQIGRTLKFSRAFTTDDSVFGYSIKVPSILYTDDITTGTDEVQVDNPMWLAYMVAADFARNDVVKTSQYDNILAYADQLMQRMKQANGGAFDTIPRAGFVMGESWI